MNIKWMSILMASALVLSVVVVAPTIAADTNPPSVTDPSASPATIAGDGSQYAELIVHVVDDTAIDNVTVDLTPIGGDIVYMHCKANYTEDGSVISIFNYTTNATCSPGTYNLAVNATDIYGNYNNIKTISLGTVSAQEWYVPITTETATEGSNPNLGFGTNESATDGFDSGLDVPHPPTSPGATFDAYFIIPESHPIFGNSMDVDYRTPADEINWTLYATSSTETIDITWDSTGVPADVMLTMDTNGDGVADVNMVTENSTSLPAGTYEIIINAKRDKTAPTIFDLTPTPGSTIYDTTPEISASYTDEESGINISSVVIKVDDIDVTADATVSESSVSYTPTTELTEGEHSVFVSVSDNAQNTAEKGWTFNISLAVVRNISLNSGWNMISIPISGETTVPTEVAVVYEYTPGVGYVWVTPTAMEPGKGYWAAATAPCNITVTGTPVYYYTASLSAGWNMVGSVYESVSISDPQDDPDGSVQPFAYWYNPETGSYAYTTTIEPKKGYWVAAIQDCNLAVGMTPPPPP